MVVAWKKDQVDSFALGDTIYRIEYGDEFIKLLDGKKSKVATELTADLFAGATEVYYCNGNLTERGKWEHAAKLAGSAQFYVIGQVNGYTKTTFDYFAKQEVKLLLTESGFADSIWIKKDKFYRILRILGGYLLVEAGRGDIQVFTSSYYFTRVFLREALVKYEPKQSYRLRDMRFVKSDNKPIKTIARTIEADTMYHYLTAEFDREFMQEYIQFADYDTVRYEVTLQPPLLLSDAEASDSRRGPPPPRTSAFF